MVGAVSCSGYTAFFIYCSNGLKLKVAFFSNQFADLHGHGLARYARELFSALQKADGTHEILPVAAWSSLSEAEVAGLRRKTGLEILPWGQKLTPLAWAFFNNPKIENWLQQPVDLVHAVALGYPVATRKPYVVTVHDLGPLTHPAYFTPKGTWIMKRSLKQMVDRAAGIICVSQSTANELESYCGGGVADRIHVVHEGVSPLFLAGPEENGFRIESGMTGDLGIGDVPFILSAGAISPRKNVHRIIQAMSRLADRIPHHLVLVGGKGWSDEQVHEELDNSGIADRVHLTGYASDEQLKGLFAAASAYVHPSLYEGFGLTVLEAMAQGCPVVTSNVYSLPEVAGDAALLVDPTSVDEIAAAIEAVCMDSVLAADLVSRGKVRVKSFSWEDCAAGVIQVYRSVV